MDEEPCQGAGCTKEDCLSPDHQRIKVQVLEVLVEHLEEDRKHIAEDWLKNTDENIEDTIKFLQKKVPSIILLYIINHAQSVIVNSLLPSNKRKEGLSSKEIKLERNRVIY